MFDLETLKTKHSDFKKKKELEMLTEVEIDIKTRIIRNGTNLVSVFSSDAINTYLEKTADIIVLRNDIMTTMIVNPTQEQVNRVNKNKKIISSYYRIFFIVAILSTIITYNISSDIIFSILMILSFIAIIFTIDTMLEKYLYSKLVKISKFNLDK